jgi:hypothetical protein
MRKLMFIVSLLVMALCMALPTFAQDSTVFCGTLAAADCDVLKAAQAASLAHESGTVDFTGSFVMTGIPDVPNITVGIDGNAAFAVDKAAMDALNAQFEGMDETNIDVNALVTGVLEALKAFNATLVMNITLPADIAQMAGIPSNTIALDMAFVGGKAYFNFDKFDPTTGGMLAAQGMTGVGGIDVVEIATMAIANDSSFLDQMQGMMNMMMANPAMMDANATAQQLAFVEKYASVTRTDGGSGEAVFITTIDVAGLFADPDFATYMQQQMAQQGNEMTDQQFQQMLGVLQLMGNDITVEVEEHIDTASSNTTFTGLSLKIDAATLLQLAGTPAQGDAVISLDLDFSYGGFNATTVTAPANAQMADSAMIAQMLAGSMGQ